MSIQFGRWNFEGQPATCDYVAKVCEVLRAYGPDSDERYSKGGLDLLYRAFHTSAESHREVQPALSPSGAVITWDGRLDNRLELIHNLRNGLTVDCPDIAIVVEAYERWRTGSFAKLVGDWALSIVDPANRTLILAKDPTGVRHLYYTIERNQVTWSTILDPLVLFAGRSFMICEEYIAAWLATSVFPAADLTPYVGICAVPPSSFVFVRPGKHTVSKYWDFDPAKRIRYAGDAEYEEHFRSVFAQAVRRRLRSDRPVLAELSGGMDSSSIVCMAEGIIARGEVDLVRLDTLSWYDDSYDSIEPDWNEYPYIARVEEKLGRTGFHINIGALGRTRKAQVGMGHCFDSTFDKDRFAATPSSARHLSDLFKQYAVCMLSRGNRTVLSGIGGDEPTGGGVPTPRPELQNLVARARVLTLARQLRAWSARMKRSWYSLLLDAVRGFLPQAFTFSSHVACSAPWFNPDFIRRNHGALCGYPFRVKVFGPLPSFQDHIDKLNANRRFQEHVGLRPELLRDLRFPYLDRDFLEFMFAIPREQIVGVGKRRSLMRRALVGIVPDQILSQKRRKFVPQESIINPVAGWQGFPERGERALIALMGIVAEARFVETWHRTRHNEMAPSALLMRALTLERWLRHLAEQRVLRAQQLSHQDSIAHHLQRPSKFRGRVRPTSSAS